VSEDHNRPTAVTTSAAGDPPAAIRSTESSPAEPLADGQLIAGRYRLRSPIATGGMATVWHATDEILTRPVAVKILHARLAADPEFVARFRREAVAAARLSHPSIVAIYDTCDDPEAIVMELVEGRTLRAELDTRRLIPPAEAVAVASGIAQALEIAHKAGIVHRDVKPANVLLSRDGRLKVADFGIAKAARGSDSDPELPDLTAVGHMVGTAKYLSPEQVSGGEVDARTDVYALGAVLYEMLCGRAPFVADNDLATATARLHAMPERPRSVLRTIPPRLDEIVMKALATDPADRYPSAAALWADLQAAPVDVELGGSVGGADQPTADATTVTAAPSFARAERSWLVPAMLVSLVAVALGVAWMLIGGTEARRDLFDLVDRVSPGGKAVPQSEPVELVAATAFDPMGTGGENDDQAGLAIDGDPATAWPTERYDTRLLGGLKDGVGIHAELGDRVDLDEVVVESPSAGWAAFVFVADQPGATLADWGEPVGAVTGAEPGSTAIELADAEGRHVLLWITDLGTEGGFRFDLKELAATAS
jgi:hypothetical protein